VVELELPEEVVDVAAPPPAEVVAVAPEPVVLLVCAAGVGVEVEVSHAASSGIRSPKKASIEIKRAIRFIGSFLLSE
jgi:hypothetical protein